MEKKLEENNFILKVDSIIIMLCANGLFSHNDLSSQDFTSPQGNQERTPLPAVGEVNAIKVTRTAPEGEEETPSISTAVFGCMKGEWTQAHIIGYV